MLNAKAIAGYGPSMPSAMFIPFVVACALFMENLDATVISTALPAIAADLHEDPIALKLALTSYMLSLAAFIPVSGWLADRRGARVVFRAAIAVFVLGSILCGASSSLAGFVAARIIQGAGGAMVPVGRLVLLRSFPRSELVTALAWLTIPELVGPPLAFSPKPSRPARAARRGVLLRPGRTRPAREDLWNTICGVPVL
jgi:MFS family permease